MLTQERLKELLHYDAESGVFTRLVASRGKRTKVGDIAGCFTQEGYCLIMLDGRSYKAHRLAWLYVYGEWPKGNIDHRLTMSNAILNLRDATQSVNVQNIRHAKKNSKSGLLGAFWKPEKGKFLAQLCHQRKAVYLGYYDTAQGAHEAYLVAKRRLHEGCTI
jgi:hypothetical protein